MISRPFDPTTRHFVPSVEDRSSEENPLSRNEPALPVREILRQTRREAELSFDDLLPYRTFAAWRIIRLMAIWKGMAQTGDTLIDALAPGAGSPDPWLLPEPMTKALDSRKGRTAFTEARQYLVPPEFIRLHSDAESLNPGFLPQAYNETLRSIPLLPPPIPPACKPIETYNPDRDPLLRFYLACLRHAARSLEIEHGSSDCPLMGKWGMAGLTDPWRIRQLFPSRLQIVAIEQAMIEETLQLMVGPEKQIGAEDTLRRQYGLDRIEILSLVRMAKAEAYRRTQGDLEHDRAMMILRLEEFCRRCHQALDLRSELMAMKHMAVVLGLARAETGDMMSDMAEVVRTVSQERSRPLPNPED